MDGTSLAATGAERYEVRMADETLHLYLRPDVTVPEGVVFRHAGRIWRQGQERQPHPVVGCRHERPFGLRRPPGNPQPGREKDVRRNAARASTGQALR